VVVGLLVVGLLVVGSAVAGLLVAALLITSRPVTRLLAGGSPRTALRAAIRWLAPGWRPVGLDGDRPLGGGRGVPACGEDTYDNGGRREDQFLEYLTVVFRVGGEHVSPFGRGADLVGRMIRPVTSTVVETNRSCRRWGAG
jgi:hypothetical protein